MTSVLPTVFLMPKQVRKPRGSKLTKNSISSFYNALGDLFVEFSSLNILVRREVLLLSCSSIYFSVSSRLDRQETVLN